MFLETFAVPPLGCNCSIVGDEAAREAIVIDPGGDAEGILRRLSSRGFTVKAIVHTHTHIDHVGATARVQRDTGAPARVHEADAFLYEMLDVQERFLGLRGTEKITLDTFLKDGESLSFGRYSLGVVHTPGHTPGSVCFQLATPEKTLVFSGDTLFAGSIGRTDLWGGDSSLILRSIRTRLLTLPEDTLVIPGHDRSTTIGREKRSNPYVGSRA